MAAQSAAAHLGNRPHQRFYENPLIGQIFGEVNR